MITIEQLKAARSLLGWTQKQLSDASGLSLASVANFEQGKGKARGKTHAAIQEALEQAGIEFTPEPGVRLRREKFQFNILEGHESVFELWNDVITTLGVTGGEILMSGIKESIWLERYKPELTEWLNKIFALNIRTRLLIAEGDHEVLISPDAYRSVPTYLFQQNPYFIYGDRFALISWGPPQRIMLIKNAVVADTFRRQFEFNYQLGREVDPKKAVVIKIEGIDIESFKKLHTP